MINARLRITRAPLLISVTAVAVLVILALIAQPPFEQMGAAIRKLRQQEEAWSMMAWTSESPDAAIEQRVAALRLERSRLETARDEAQRKNLLFSGISFVALLTAISIIVVWLMRLAGL